MAGPPADDQARTAPVRGRDPDPRSAAAAGAGALRRRGAPDPAGRGPHADDAGAAGVSSPGTPRRADLKRIRPQLLRRPHREDLKRAAIISLIVTLGSMA